MDQHRTMSMERLRVLLEAYGAEPTRWPPDEREAALALLGISAEARASRDISAQLDALLDAAPVPRVPDGLADRIWAAAHVAPRAIVDVATPGQVRPELPQSRPPRPALRRRTVWRSIAMTLPLAAAAAWVLWLTAEPPAMMPPTEVAIAELVYDTPTDRLLAAPGLDTLDSVPTFGCTDSGLGCIDAEAPNTQSTVDLEKDV